MTSPMILKRVVAATLLAGCLAIGGAQAQIRGDAPVDIAADSWEAVNSEGLAIWRGEVEVVQEQTRLRCSELRARFRRAGAAAGPGAGATWGDVEQMTCVGPVYYVTPTQSARADNAVYEGATETITMTGNVVVTQGQNVATGDRGMVNTRTNDMRLESNNRGRGGSDRVRTVLYPESGPRAPRPPAGGQ